MIQIVLNRNDIAELKSQLEQADNNVKASQTENNKAYWMGKRDALEALNSRIGFTEITINWQRLDGA